MSDRVREYVGFMDPCGDGQFNVGLTDEEVVRCRDCINHDVAFDCYPTCLQFGGSWADDDFCSNGHRKDRRK